VVGVLAVGLPPDEDVVPLPDDPVVEVAVVVTADPDGVLAPLITLVAGAPPPPPPQAVKTNIQAAAAKPAAVMFLCMKSPPSEARPLPGHHPNMRTH